jgi:hypothetical protein
MRRLQSYLAGLLILSVSLLALPGAFLHNCGHIDHHDHDHGANAEEHATIDHCANTGEHATIDHGDCTVCDLSAPAVPSALLTLDFSQPDFPALLQERAPEIIHSTWTADAPSRAPPMA